MRIWRSSTTNSLAVSPRLKAMFDRACAMVIDRALVYGVWLGLGMLLTFIWPGTAKMSLIPMPNPTLFNADRWPWPPVAFLLFIYGLPSLRNVVIITIYVVLTLARYQATPGMRRLGLSLSRPNGERVTWVRIVVWHLVSFLSGLCLGLGYLWALVDSKGRTWHDIAAGVVVAREPCAPLFKLKGESH